MAETEEQEFAESLSDDSRNDTPARVRSGSVPCQPDETRIDYTACDSVQWAVHPNGVYGPSGATTPALPGAVYRITRDQFGTPLLVTIPIVSDELVYLPDSAGERVLSALQRFWDSEDKFRRFGQIFKRGVLLWGPPGSGKTATVTLLARTLIARGGIVVFADGPMLTALALAKLRQIEPTRKLICILEDLDELTAQHGEAQLLALLDGENQIDNVCYLATTNYPERLDARLVNRPSRFDEVIKIGMPTAAARRHYLRSRLTMTDLGGADLQTWVTDTEGLSIAHLRELIAAVYCLGRDYDETLKRLKGMRRPPKSVGGNQIGLVTPKAQGASGD